MLEELKIIGFTDNQAKVYLALTRIGECTIGLLEKEVGLFKQSIYNTLEILIDQDLVKVAKKNNRQYFSVSDPEILASRLSAKEQIARRILPELYALSGTEKQVSEIKVYGGVKAFHSFHTKALKVSPPNTTLSVIGAGGDEFLKIMRQKYFFDRYENLRIHKNIVHKLLMYENQRNVDKEYVSRRYLWVRFLPESYHQPVATQIWPDRVAILLFGDEPQIIEIRSQKIRDGFQNYFDVLWRFGKK